MFYNIWERISKIIHFKNFTVVLTVNSFYQFGSSKVLITFCFQMQEIFKEILLRIL